MLYGYHDEEIERRKIIVKHEEGEIVYDEFPVQPVTVLYNYHQSNADEN